MPIKTACPDKSLLECYSLGQIPADDRAPLEQHLAQCSSCVEILRSLHPADSLVQTFRSGASDQTVEEASVDAPETSDEVVVVNSPVTEGIALIRAPLKGPSRASRAEEALKATSCGPYTKSG